MKTNKMRKKGQEEMVGFALIVIVVAVILIFLFSFSFSDNSEKGLESKEAESFVQSALQYTTECKKNFNYLDVQDLIFSCVNNEVCGNGEIACDVLNHALQNVTKNSWNVGNEGFYKGYIFNIDSNRANILEIERGESTSNYKGTIQSFSRSGIRADISFRVYT